MSNGLNRMFRVIWNESLGSWVAVAETASARGKPSKSRRERGVGAVTAVAVGMLALWNPNVDAAPVLATGGAPAGVTVVTSGAAPSIATTVTQNTARAVVKWSSFNLSKTGTKSETVEFKHGTAGNKAFSTLNLISDANPSSINGKITSLGEVILVNPNGVFFGKNAVVNVGSLVASALPISEANYLKGSYIFDGSKDDFAGVGNSGKITATNGSIALIGNNATNTGMLLAAQGTVSLSAADKVTLTQTNGGFTHTASLGNAVTNAFVQHTGSITSKDVALQARSLTGYVPGVNVTGTVTANHATATDGKILLASSGSNIEVNGATITGANGAIEFVGSTVFKGSTTVGGAGSSVKFAANSGSSAVVSLGSSADFVKFAADNAIVFDSGLTFQGNNGKAAFTTTRSACLGGAKCAADSLNLSQALSLAAPTLGQLEVTAKQIGMGGAVTLDKPTIIKLTGTSVQADAGFSLTAKNAAVEVTGANGVTMGTGAKIESKSINVDAQAGKLEAGDNVTLKATESVVLKGDLGVMFGAGANVIGKTLSITARNASGTGFSAGTGSTLTANDTLPGADIKIFANKFSFAGGAVGLKGQWVAYLNNASGNNSGFQGDFHRFGCTEVVCAPGVTVPALDKSGFYYAERPTLALALSKTPVVYGSADPGSFAVNLTGLAAGDDAAAVGYDATKNTFSVAALVAGTTSTAGKRKVGEYDASVTADPFSKAASLGYLVGGVVAGGKTSFTTAKALNVTAKEVDTVVAATATVASKVYDGTTAATVSSFTTGTLNAPDIVAKDVVSMKNAAVATFADKNASLSEKNVTVALSLEGADAGNYVLKTKSITKTAKIDKKTVAWDATAIGKVTVNAATTKVYDRTTGQAATVVQPAAKDLAALLGVAEAGMAVTLSVSGGKANFSDQNVGDGKTLKATVGISGVDAANFNFSAPEKVISTTASITAKSISAYGLSGLAKEYNGETDLASTAQGLVAGVVFGDTVHATVTGKFQDEDAGANFVTAKFTGLAGADKGNYTLKNLGSGITALATISQKLIDLSTIVGAKSFRDKVYDGSDSAQLVASLTQTNIDKVMVAADAGKVQVDIKSSFVDRIVAVDGALNPVAKTINATGTLLGDWASNYKLVGGGAYTSTAKITPRVINVASLTPSRAYDGTTAFSVTGNTTSSQLGLQLAGVTANTDPILAADKDTGPGKPAVGVKAVGVFNSVNASSSKTYTGATLSLTGTPLNNYKLASTTISGGGVISQKSLPLSSASKGFVYNCAAVSSCTVSTGGLGDVTGLVSGDGVGQLFSGTLLRVGLTNQYTGKINMLNTNYKLDTDQYTYTKP